MQSRYIKEEPKLSDILEHTDEGFNVSESFTNNPDTCISIIKEEIDISEDTELDEKIIDDNLDNNVIVLKNLGSSEPRASSERISKSEISRFKKADIPGNIDQNDVNSQWSSNCNLHCFQCNKTINATSSFKTTKCQTCKITMRLQCKKCERSFNRRDTMRFHLMSRCYPEQKYNCAHCNFETTTQKYLQRHIQRRHNENNQPIECPKCHKILKHIYALRQHQRFCETEGRISCTICPYKSHYSNNVKRHMIRNHSHERLNNLMQQSRINANIDSMIDNINSRSAKDLKKCKILNYFERFCPQCNTTFENNTFSNRRSANFTYECHLCKTRLLLQCLTCNTRLNDLKKMKEHLLTKCALKINYKCPECDYETAYKCNLKDHVKRCHTIIDPKELKTCPKCNKSFRIIRDFNVHQKSCGMKRYDYHCDHCVFRTKRKRNMKIHTQIHMNTGSVKVKNNSNDKYSIKAYCSTCKALRKAGPQSTMLCFVCKNLMMFKCRNCDEKALTKKDIRLHESKKHGCVYHECPNCDKAFLRLSILTKHKKICKIAAAQKK